MDGTLVLVVDDDVGVREFLTEALQVEGYLVVCAANGQDALDCLDCCTPVVMLLDLQMPLLDGRAVLRALELRPRRPGVIVMSAEYHFSDGFGHSAADACLAKPFSVTDLLDMVQRVQRAA